MTKEELAFRLKTAREATGLSLIEAAQRLSFPSYQTLSNIENAQREVKVSELARFARTYFCSLGDFLTGEVIEKDCAILWRNQPATDELKKEAEREIFPFASNIICWSNCWVSGWKKDSWRSLANPFGPTPRSDVWQKRPAL